MKSKAANAFMAIGILLVAAALALFSYNTYADKKGEKTANAALLDIIEEVGDGIEETVEINDGNKINPEMKTKRINGYDYIGYISIPSLSIKLPVMAQCDQTRLTIAPCRYKGSTKTDNLIIAAHNYRSHFGNLKSLKIGERVTFTDMEKKKNVYKVAGFEELLPTDVKQMESGEYDLTLFTCTYGGRTRITVRLIKEK